MCLKILKIDAYTTAVNNNNYFLTYIVLIINVIWIVRRCEPAYTGGTACTRKFILKRRTQPKWQRQSHEQTSPFNL